MLQVSLEWFDYTEPYLTASSHEEQGVEGTCTHIPGGATALNLFEPPHGVSVLARALDRNSHAQWNVLSK